MPAAARHQHRHYKTLIVLVLAMTGGAYFLYGIAKLSPIVPVTPLRAKAQSPVRYGPQWASIDVREQVPGQSRGFYHWRIDSAGKLIRSDAWDASKDPNGDGAIQVLVSSSSKNGGLTTRQSKQLKVLIDDLCKTYGISKDGVKVR